MEIVGTIWTTMPDGRVIGAPAVAMDEETAATLREQAAGFAHNFNHLWCFTGNDRFAHYYIEGSSLCEDAFPKGSNYAPKRVMKALRCKECQYLNEKRKRDEKRLESLAAD